MNERSTHRAPRLSRRRLLQGIAYGTLAQAVPGRLASADGGPRRPANLVLLFHPNGLEDGWQPRDVDGDGFSERRFELGEALAALGRHREDILVVEGIRGGIGNEILGHQEGMTSLWTGARIDSEEAFAGHPSIDRLIAERLGGGTPFSTLDLGVQTSAGGRFRNTTAMLYDGRGVAVEPEDDPNAAFERLFRAGMGGPDELAAARRARRSVFDLVRAQLGDIGGSYGRDDRARLEQHRQHLSDLEARLQALAEQTCETDFPEHPYTATRVSRDDALFPEVAALQMDLLVSALSCGLARVASLQLSDSISTTRIPGVNERAGVHTLMHTGSHLEKVRINQWFAGQVASLLDRLAAVDVGGGRRLLDDTLVVWGTEMAIGNHLNDPVPFVLAGGGRDDGYFELGRRVRLAGAPRHTRLLVSVLHAFGLEEVQQVGDFSGPEDVGALSQLRGARS